MDATNGDAPDVSAGKEGAGRRPLGEIFVELGFINRSQLEAALVVQRRTGARIGEILVEQGCVSRLDLASALAEHWEPRSYPSDDLVGPSPTAAPRPVADATEHAEESAATSDLEAPPEPVPDRPVEKLPERSRWALRRGRASAVPASAAAEQVDAPVAGLAPLEEVERAIAELQTSVVELGRRHVVDGVATETRLTGAEDAVTRLEKGLGTLTQLVAELRTELDELATRPANEEPSNALHELSLRIDRVAREGHDLAAALGDELRDEGRIRAAELKALGEALAQIERRLDEQAALGEEQARAIEVALLEGLNGLGKRLTRSAKKRGKDLRRPIERLGAAITEAETLADRRNLMTEAAGCVAFAPTEFGYRLVELPWRPDVGATIEVDGSGRLAVTRYGRSPLPFDRRPCAFLERARA